MIFLGFGSNTGDRFENLKGALKYFDITRVSSIYETSPVGDIHQRDFLNCVAEIRTKLLPKDLLKEIKAIERKLGRKPGPRWGPRVIDIDILFYHYRIINEPELVIPHPRLHERLFVLIPLAEIEPEFTHPVLKKSIKQLVKEAQNASREKCKKYAEARAIL